MGRSSRIVSIRIVTFCLSGWPALAWAQEESGGGVGFGPLIGAVAGILFGAWLAVIRIKGHKDRG